MMTTKSSPNSSKNKCFHSNQSLMIFFSILPALYSNIVVVVFFFCWMARITNEQTKKLRFTLKGWVEIVTHWNVPKPSKLRNVRNKPETISINKVLQCSCIVHIRRTHCIEVISFYFISINKRIVGIATAARVDMLCYRKLTCKFSCLWE